MDESGVQTCGQPAEQDLEEEESDQERRPRRENPPLSREVWRGGSPSDQKEAEEAAIDDERQAQMGGQSILADIGLLGETALHHFPSEPSLQGDEEEDCRQLSEAFWGDGFCDPEEAERDKEGQSEDSSERAMRPFSPIEIFELGEAYSLMLFFIVGGFLVELEAFLPLGFGCGGEDSDDGFPVGDGESGVGEADESAEQDHSDYEGAEGCDPELDGVGEVVGGLGQVGGGGAD